MVGQTDSSANYSSGVLGYASAASGYTYGVTGQAPSPNGVGVWGYASSNSTSGVPVGVLGEAPSASGWGVFSIGDMGASGLKLAVVQTEDFGWRRLYAVESPEVWFEDFGTGQLVNGQVTIEFESIYAQTINLESEYHIYLTPLGDCQLYVSNKDIGSFTVNAMGGQTCSIDFDYRIVAKRLGYEDERLASENPPISSQGASDISFDADVSGMSFVGEDFRLPGDK